MQKYGQVQQQGTNAPDVISDATGQKLTELDTKKQWMSPMAIFRALPGVADRLRDGKDVPMGIGAADGSSGHVVLMTDVRGSGPSAEYLISDPASGRTGWVTGSQLALDPKGWMGAFGLSHDQVTGFLE